VAGTRPAPSPLERIAAAARTAVAWLWMPRPLTVAMRPAWALGAVAIVALLAGAMSVAVAPSGGQNVHTAAAELPAAQLYVQFRLEAEGASHVALVGSFNGWQPVHEMRQTMPGAWSILIPLQPGVYDYAFVVDGLEWVGDPHAFQVDDGFGGANSRIALPYPTATRRT
jgi:hypothetical protein